MYGLTLQPWHSPVELLESGLCIVSNQPDYNILIITSNEPPGKELTTGMVVRTLYEAITAMARRDPGFHMVSSVMKLDDERIGKLFIDSSDLSLPNLDLPNTTSILEGLDASNTSLTNAKELNATTQLSDTRSLTDPHDRKLKISWKWDPFNIPAQDIFSATLNALATSAQYDKEGPVEHITAFSTSGNAILHIGRLTSVNIYGGIVSRVFYLLITELFLKRKRFEECWFEVSYEGLGIADGYFHKVERVGGSEEGRASE